MGGASVARFGDQGAHAHPSRRVSRPVRGQCEIEWDPRALGTRRCRAQPDRSRHSARPRRTVMFSAMVINFVPLLSPANQMSYDTLQFYNFALAINAGSGVGALFRRAAEALGVCQSSVSKRSAVQAA